MGFSDELRREADGIWQAIFIHPFVVELSEGTLPLEKFKFYIKQDYVFLVEFCRALTLGASKVEGIRELKTFAEFLHNTITIEMGAEEEFAKSLGISQKELEETRPSPTNYAYTRHILNSAYSDQLGGLIACIMPCIQSYMEIGQRLKNSPGLARAPVYEKWASTYWGEKYAKVVAWRKSTLDILGEKAGEPERALMRRRYFTSSEYEFMFWEMAYNLEKWPI